MADDSKTVGLAWFLAGLGVGALVGILYAPKSGRETREDLVNGAREGGEYLRSKGRETAKQMGDYVDRGRAQWEEFVERGKNLVNDQTTRVSAAVEAGRDAYKAASAERTAE